MGPTLLRSYILFSTTALLTLTNAIEHNLPPGVELVDPKSLGFDPSSIDLSAYLGGGGGAGGAEAALAGIPGGIGNLKLTPVLGQTDPKTGTKTQVLTVGFDPNEEDLNLDDFELPSLSNGSSNQSELVQNAFQSFKSLYKKKNGTSSPQVIRRRKIVKATQSPPIQPKVVELDSAQIDKLLATGKLKSKKVGGSDVIEITQEQLNELYQMENGEEIKQLLAGQPTTASNLYPQQQQQEIQPTTYRPSSSSSVVNTAAVTTTTTTTRVVPTTNTTPITTPIVTQQPATAPPTTTAATPTSTTSTGPTDPPVIFQFNTKDLPPQQPPIFSDYVSSNYVLNTGNQYIQSPQQPRFNQQLTQGYVQQPPPQQQQQQHKILRKPTFEFISVPPVSYSTVLENHQQQRPHPPPPQRPSQNQQLPQQQQQLVRGFRQDPLPSSGRFPPQFAQGHRRPTPPLSGGQVFFPSASSSTRTYRSPPSVLNTFYPNDGLNFKRPVAAAGVGVAPSPGDFLRGI